jgi:esterase/lipase superfamily enzyme
MYVAGVEFLEEDRFYQTIRSIIPTMTKHSILVFVHGYNVSFRDAALRTAQLVADLPFQGVPAFYSWPSAADAGGYLGDLRNAQNSGYYLADFLEGLAHEAYPDRIHIVAHSMGSEVLAQAIRRLGPGSHVNLGQVVFVAPDLERRAFVRDVFPILLAMGAHVTTYASDADLALQASRRFNRAWRLGLGGDSLVVLRDMDTIDAARVRTDLLGHSPFASDEFLDDLSQVLNEETPPPRRLLQVSQGDLRFYRFRTPAR